MAGILNLRDREFLFISFAKPIGVTALLDDTYAHLKERGREVQFEHYALVADDSDDHRTRSGYMKYGAATLLDIAGKQWALARGTAHGDYPIREYEGDIMAVPVETTLDEAFCNPGFTNSVLIGLKDGSVCLGSSHTILEAAYLEPMRERLRRVLPANIEGKYAEHAHYPEFWKGNAERAKYKAKLPKLLAPEILGMLKEYQASRNL